MSGAQLIEVERDGVKLACRRFGEGPPVLALHGLADHGGVWAPLAHRLEGFSVLAPDLRGHGLSDKPQRGYDTDTLIADLERVLSATSVEQAHVVAHSWSAKTAVRWAAARPERFRSLTLIDPFFIGRMPGVARLLFPLLFRVLPFLQLKGPFASLQAAEARAVRSKEYRGLSPEQRAVLLESLEQGADGQWRERFARHALTELFTEVMRVDGLAMEVSVPTLLVLPQQGVNRFGWQVRPYRKRVRQLKQVRVPGHHWAFLTAPDAVAPALFELYGGRADPRLLAHADG